MPKHYLTSLIILASLILFATSTVKAQSNRSFVIRIPFDFVVPGGLLPAGNYVIERVDSNKTTRPDVQKKPIPVNSELAKAFRLWKMKTIYNRPSDWVYASPAKNGTQPYWPKSIYRVYIKRAADRIGLKKRIGWHTFRHTFGTILNANGENPKVIQELLRHATLKVTMDT